MLRKGHGGAGAQSANPVLPGSWGWLGFLTHTGRWNVFALLGSVCEALRGIMSKKLSVTAPNDVTA